MIRISLAGVLFCFLLPGSSTTVWSQSRIIADERSSDTESRSIASKTSNSPAPQRILKNRLLFPHGKVLMSLPKRQTADGSFVPMLRPFTVDEFDRHYGVTVRPEFAFIDDSTDSRISVSVTQTRLARIGNDLTELEAYKEKLEKSIARSVKDIIWHKREILRIGDLDWVHLEMQNLTTADDGSAGSTVMNDFYVTSMGGHPLMFTITANTKHWYEIRKIMQKMMLSVTVQEKRITDDPSDDAPATSKK